MAQTDKSLEMLFVSKVRIKALRYFLLNPHSPIHLRGAVREFKEEINAVRRELLRLQKIGLLDVEKQGNKNFFKLNNNHVFYSELAHIVHKSFGLGSEIIKEAKHFGTVDFAFLTPAYTQAIYHGDQIIDLVLVGNIDVNKLQDLVGKYEGIRGKEIHFSVFTNSEFQTRKRRKDEFTQNLIQQDITMLVGRKEDLIRGEGI